jgi:hypothetical protein
MEALPMPIDLKRLAAEVSVQHGIRIDHDDPMMAVVTLNRLVFEAAVAQVLERVQAAARDFEMAAEKVQVRAGGVLAREVRDSGVAMRQEVRKLVEEFRCVGPGSNNGTGRDHLTRADRKWLVIGLVFALTLFAMGVGVGARLPELDRFWR